MEPETTDKKAFDFNSLVIFEKGATEHERLKNEAIKAIQERSKQIESLSAEIRQLESQANFHQGGAQTSQSYAESILGANGLTLNDYLEWRKAQETDGAGATTSEAVN